MTTRIWSGRFPNDVDASTWTPNGSPVAGDTAVINGKTIELGGVFPVNLAIQINAGPLSTNNAALDVSYTSFSVGDQIVLTAQSYGSVTLQASSPVTNNGLIAFREIPGGGGVPSGSLILTGDGSQPPVFTNASVIELGARDVMIGGAGTLVNNGSIVLSHPDGDASTYSLGDFEVAVGGTGTIHIKSGTEADFNAPVGANQVVAFEPGNLASPIALVERPESFLASFAGFTAGSRIVLSTPTYDGTQVTADNGVTKLAFTRGGVAVATLTFQGSYTSDQLALSPVAYTTLETVTITTTAQVVSGGAPIANDIPGLPVFRFFDTRLGTHFFTADVNEAGRVAASRPDLISEGVGLRAVNPVANDPNAEAIYRFFDTTDGTHFFTASESEQAAVIATRPDLVFEPSSTFSEHSTAQAGDVAVYRFFDTVHGTHFYTANTAEQANIAATRPDLVAEGIGFYAPAS